MPEFEEERDESQNGSGPIPNLFPDKLVDLCLEKVSFPNIIYERCHKGLKLS